MEYRLLDALDDLKGKLTELQDRPPVWCPAGNWWDEIDPQIGELLGEGMVYQNFLPTKTASSQVLLLTGLYRDRLELTLRVNGAINAWQRALFYGRRPATHGQRLPYP